MDIKDKDQFICWMQRALGSHEDGTHTDDNYIELYNILLRLALSNQPLTIELTDKFGV